MKIFTSSLVGFEISPNFHFAFCTKIKTFNSNVWFQFIVFYFTHRWKRKFTSSSWKFFRSLPYFFPLLIFDGKKKIWQTKSPKANKLKLLHTHTHTHSISFYYIYFFYYFLLIRIFLFYFILLFNIIFPFDFSLFIFHCF